MSGRAGLQSDRYLGTGLHTRKSPGPRHMASTHLSTPVHIILVDAGAHCMYCMHDLSTLGSDPWVPFQVPVVSRRPVASRRRVEARPSHKWKSHLSKMQLPPATQGPGPGPSPSSASVSRAGLVSQKQTSRLPRTLRLPLPPASTSASFALFTPLQQPHGLLTYSLPLSRPSLVSFSPGRLPSNAPALRRVHEPDLPHPTRPPPLSLCPSTSGTTRHRTSGRQSFPANQTSTAAIPCQTTAHYNTTHHPVTYQKAAFLIIISYLPVFCQRQAATADW